MLTSEMFLDFIYVGTPRAGATWLRAALGEHPELRLAARPPAERCRIAPDPVLAAIGDPAGLDAYRDRFEHAEAYSVLGDIVPGCALDPCAAGLLARPFPNLKVVAFLREPIAMLRSLYRASRARGAAPTGLEAALLEHPEWLELALYHRLMTPFFDHFPPEQICIVMHDRFFTDEAANLPELLRFLEVDEVFRPSVLGYNVEPLLEAEAPLRRRLRDLLAPPPRDRWHISGSARHPSATEATRIRYKPDIVEGPEALDEVVSADARERILELIDHDLARLERDIGVDLGHWRAPAAPLMEPLADNVIQLPVAAAALRRRRAEAALDG